MVGLQKRTSKPPVLAGFWMEYFCTAMLSETRESRTRSRESRRFAAPVASVSDASSGKASNTFRPTRSARERMATPRYESLAATITKSGSNTSRLPGMASNSSL